MGRTTPYLIIVESPSKCAKIESFLGPKYKCIATRGHIREITDLSGVIISDTGKVDIQFFISKEKAAHVREIRSVIKNYKSDCIYLATDDDREGEAIAWHVCQVFHLPVLDTPRIVFHEITASAVRAAVSLPRRICMKTVSAQHARQVLDILVGYTISPFLWKNVASTQTLSAGRCQTPALRLVYEHSLERGSNNNINILYDIKAHFFHQIQLPFFIHDFSGNIPDFFDQSVKFKHVLTIEPSKESVRQAPKPLNTSRLLQYATNRLNITPKQTMDLCQELYQQGFITYMRTDSTQYSNEFIQQASQYITSTFGEKYVYVSPDIQMSSETKIINPHEAIRVTRLEVAYIPRVDKQPKLHLMYRLIWERSVESCMANAIYDITKLSMTSPWDRYFYTASLEIPTFLGWQKVATTMDTDTVARISSMKLFLTQVKDGLLPIHMETVVRETNHGKPYYSESTLIHRLEEYGIGRPSTYALIVHTLIDREYIKVQDVSGSAVTYKHFYLDTPQNIVCEIEKEIILGSEKRRLVIQPLGVSVIQYLIEHFEHLFSYDYTRNMEDTLDLVDETNWMDICVHCKNTIVPPQTIYQSITPRPTNDSVLRYVTTDISIRTAKYGPYIYYKTQKMGKPAFYSITKCKLSYMDCSSEELISWMSKTYNRKF